MRSAAGAPRCSSAFYGERKDRETSAKMVELDLDTTGFVAGIQKSNFTSPKELGAVLARSPQCQECMVKQYFRYTAGRTETSGDRPLIRKVAEDFRRSKFQFKELIISMVRSREFPAKEARYVSQVITKRARVSRRAFLKGVTLSGTAIQVGLPPLVSMFNSQGPLRRWSTRAEGAEKGDREPVRLLVQRKRHPGAILDPGRDGRDYRHAAVPLAARAISQRHSHTDRAR